MMKIQFIFLVALTPFLLGCLDFQKQDQIERLDKLADCVDSIQQITREQQIENLNDIGSMIDSITLQTQTLGDTISIDLAVLLDHFKLSSTALAPYLSVKKYLDTNSRLLLVSISNLEKDIDKANGARSKYNEYISYESQKVDTLLAYLDSLILLKSTLLDGFENYFPTLNHELSGYNFEAGTNLDNN